MGAQNKMKGKKAMSISIALLVVLTLVLTSVSLFYFNSKQKTNAETIALSSVIDEVYIRGALVNYYVQDILEKSVEDFYYENGTQVFIDNFLSELGKYKNENGIYIVKDLEQIENQLIEENIDLNSSDVVLSLKIKLIGSREKISIEHNYKKDFKKVFK